MMVWNVQKNKQPFKMLKQDKMLLAEGDLNIFL